jgi:hypothetical protein
VIAKTVSKVDEAPTHDKKTTTIIEFINMGNIVTRKKCIGRDGSQTGEIDESTAKSYMPYIREGQFARDFGVGNGSDKILLNCINLRRVDNLEHRLMTYRYNPSEIIQVVLRRMVTTEYVFHMNGVIYDAEHNIGLYPYEDGVNLFRFTSIKGGDELEFHIASMDLSSGDIDTSTRQFVKHTHSYWYWSEQDPDCPGQRNTIDIERSYLSVYGSLPRVLAPIVEVFARQHLRVHRDEDELEEGTPRGSDYIRTGEKYYY